MTYFMDAIRQHYAKPPCARCKLLERERDGWFEVAGQLQQRLNGRDVRWVLGLLAGMAAAFLAGGAVL